ncbi:uncharacterized protein TNCV_4754621 [Trichonephila clavipes]|nr:uncharacterized protein TNCV_4754621 [Trichonephila clavipes]
MLIYEFPSSSLRCRANPNLFRRSFEPFDQMLYHRMVLEPQTTYPIPAGTRYILLTIQKTVFGLDIIPETLLPQLMENGFNLGDFRKRNRFDQKAYKLPPPTPSHAPFETKKRPLEQPGYFSKKKRVIITPIIRPSMPPVMIIKPSTALATPQPVSIPEPPERKTPQVLLSDPPPERTTPQILLSYPPPERTTPQILLPDPPVPTTPQILLQDPPVPTTPQILLPDPPVPTTPQILLPDPPKQTTPQILLPDPPVVKTLEPTFTDDYSMDQILSSVFGDYLQQGIPLAHTQEPQVLDTVPSLFDESNVISSHSWIILKQGWS